MPQNSIEGSSQTDPIPLGDFLRSPEEVLGATGDPAREEKMQGRALSAEVDATADLIEHQGPTGAGPKDK